MILCSHCWQLEKTYQTINQIQTNFNTIFLNDSRYHDTIEAYDPVRDVWENVGEMPSSRSWLSCVPLMVRY